LDEQYRQYLSGLDLFQVPQDEAFARIREFHAQGAKLWFSDAELSRFNLAQFFEGITRFYDPLPFLPLCLLVLESSSCWVTNRYYVGNGVCPKSKLEDDGGGWRTVERRRRQRRWEGGRVGSRGRREEGGGKREEIGERIDGSRGELFTKPVTQEASQCSTIFYLASPGPTWKS
jgi:hypothetical protein